VNVKAMPFVLLVRRDPARFKHRDYAMRVARDLFGDWALLRERGRVGSPGQMRADGGARAAGPAEEGSRPHLKPCSAESAGRLNNSGCTVPNAAAAAHPTIPAWSISDD
jgi:hypothetical protein